MKLLVCYKKQSSSKHIVVEALKHARVWDAEIILFHGVKRNEPIKHSKLLEIEEQLETEALDLFSNTQISYRTHLDVDDVDVGDKIIELARDMNADMIFIGPKKRSKVGKLVFGSTAQTIILNADCPVVTLTRS